MKNPILDELRAKLVRSLEEKRSAQGELDEILAKVANEKRSELTQVETLAFAETRAKRDAYSPVIEELQATIAAHEADELRSKADEDLLASLDSSKVETRVDVISEPMLYRKGGEHSYFRDMAKANEPGNQDPAARTRLQRHAKEMDVELRANMNRTDGTGGEAVPPLWLMSEFINVARAGRITADLCRRLPLPAGTDSINLPRLATGTAVAEQTDGASVQKTDATTNSVSGAVTTLAGQQVFAMQLFDQSPLNFDEVVFGDLLADLAKQVDAYVLNKASIGILNVSSIISVAYTDASPTVPELYPKIADGVQQVETLRFLPPQAIVMHPRRWAWHLASLDSSNRPLVVPNAQGPTNAFAGMSDVRAEGSVGSLQGLPVYVDPNVPVNLGAGTNEDRIITARFDDLFLFEGDVKSRVLFETDADTLSVRLQVWEYLAFIGSRFPKAIAVTSGTGLVTPTF